MSDPNLDKTRLSQAAKKKKRPKGIGGGGARGFGNRDALEVMRGSQGQGFTQEDIRLTPEFMAMLQSDRSLEQNPSVDSSMNAEEAKFSGMTAKERGELGMAQMGATRDASLFAAMLALARSNPEAIYDLVQDNGDGTYEVCLYLREDVWSMSASPVYITVDARFPVEAGSQDPLYAQALRGEETPELWAMLIEKAAAIHLGSWQNIADEYFQQADGFDGALNMLTGAPENGFDLSEVAPEKAEELIQLALSRGWALTAVARDFDEEEDDVRRDAERHTIVSGHTYAPSEMDPKQGKISMINPWGAGHIKGMNAKDLARFFSELRLVRKDSRSKPGQTA